jgi:hypothetical protein
MVLVVHVDDVVIAAKRKADVGEMAALLREKRDSI